MKPFPRNARDIREALQGTGRVYLRPMMTDAVIRVMNARERKGETQLRTQHGWHTLLIGDTVWSQEF